MEDIHLACQRDQSGKDIEHESHAYKYPLGESTENRIMYYLIREDGDPVKGNHRFLFFFINENSTGNVPFEPLIYFVTLK